MDLDLGFVRAQFPAFNDPETGRWAHLENAGGSYATRQVIDRLTRLFTANKVQPYWDSAPSQGAGKAMDESRELLAATLACDPDLVHFGPSTSQNTYVLARALAPTLSRGDGVVVTNQDHEANIGAWRRLARDGVEVREWSVDPESGLLDLADLDALLSDRTAVVAVTHASNIAATINPIAAIVDRAHQKGALVVVDGVSYAPHAAVDVDALGCDAYLYSAYKTYGPHLGIMYTSADLLERVENQGHFFNEAKPTARLTPAGPDHAEIGAAAGVVEYYEAVHDHHLGPTTDGSLRRRIAAVFELFGDHEERLMTPLLELLQATPGVRIVGSPVPDRQVRAPTVAFHSDRVTSADIYHALIDAEIACGHGHFYAYRLVEALGLDPNDGVVRLSMVHYNTADDVTRATSVLSEIL